MIPKQVARLVAVRRTTVGGEGRRVVDHDWRGLLVGNNESSFYDYAKDKPFGDLARTIDPTVSSTVPRVLMFVNIPILDRVSREINWKYATDQVAWNQALTELERLGL